jgi:hypothetical protein
LGQHVIALPVVPARGFARGGKRCSSSALRFSRPRTSISDSPRLSAGLEHESGLVGRELEQDAAGLAEVDGLVHLAIHHRRQPKLRGGHSVAPPLLVGVADRERDVVRRSGAHLAGLLGRLVVDDEAVTALAPRQPASLAPRRRPEHVTE